jgi:hypothetical protein
MARNMTDYAAACRDFRLDVPATFNRAFDVFDGWARDPGKLAMAFVVLAAGHAPARRWRSSCRSTSSG